MRMQLQLVILIYLLELLHLTGHQIALPIMEKDRLQKEIFEEAENRLHAQKAVMVLLMK